MVVQQTTPNASGWQTGPAAWEIFVLRHPELALRPGKWAFHNFLRAHREALRRADAIRLARRRFWVANAERFCEVGFACATGVDPVPSSQQRSI
jgi:hypothetical protein